MRRRAVSSGYYAVFHTIARICADEIASEHDRDSPEYVLVYRTLNHADVRKALTQGPLQSDAAIRTIGEAFGPLQDARHQADYMPPTANVITRATAQELVAKARSAVIGLDGLSQRQRQSLAVRLLIKDTKR